MKGFQLTGTTKRQKIVKVEENQSSVEMIASISEGNEISLVSPKAVVQPLVIPLHRPENVSAASVISNSKNLDKLAEEEIIAELTNSLSNNGTESQLIIEQDNSNIINKKKAPMLLAHTNPSLLNLKNDDERFKADIENRAEDMNFRSEKYDAVPVSQFGAALLRGMGWTGPPASNALQKGGVVEDKIVPRENRLGLGATAKPPESKRHGDKMAQAAIATQKDAWARKAEARLSSQKLVDGDLVWLRDLRFAGRRACVVCTKGVPGLDRVRVQLETDGLLAEVGRKDAVLLSAQDLADRPYEPMVPPGGNDDSGVPADVDYFGMRDQPATAAATDKNDSQRKRSRESEEPKRHHEVSASRENPLHHGSKIPSTSSAAQLGRKPSQQAPTAGGDWLRQGIRVKVVSRSLGGGALYKQKGVVLDVVARGVACLRLDSGAVVSEARQSQLETLLPEVGGQCVVLLGPQKGELAVLLEKHREEQTALVELLDDLQLLWLSMDAIAATAE